jgi:hypothetical protein
MEPPRLEPAPPPASPFNPSARPAPRGGCPKPLIFGCLGLLVFAGLGLVGFFLYAGTHIGKVLQFSLRESETSISTQLPKDVTPEERQRFHNAFQAARARAVKSGPQEIAESSQQLQLKMFATIRKGPDLTRKDVQELTHILEEFGKTGQAPEAR